MRSSVAVCRCLSPDSSVCTVYPNVAKGSWGSIRDTAYEASSPRKWFAGSGSRHGLRKVIPANAGIQAGPGRGHRPVGPSLWIPAFAGMTLRKFSDNPTLPVNFTYSDIPQQSPPPLQIPSPCQSHPTCLPILSWLPASARLGFAPFNRDQDRPQRVSVSIEVRKGREDHSSTRTGIRGKGPERLYSDKFLTSSTLPIPRREHPCRSISS